MLRGHLWLFMAEYDLGRESHEQHQQSSKRYASGNGPWLGRFWLKADRA